MFYYSGKFVRPFVNFAAKCSGQIEVTRRHGLAWLLGLAACFFCLFFSPVIFEFGCTSKPRSNLPGSRTSWTIFYGRLDLWSAVLQVANHFALVTSEKNVVGKRFFRDLIKRRATSGQHCDDVTESMRRRQKRSVTTLIRLVCLISPAKTDHARGTRPDPALSSVRDWSERIWNGA